MLFISETDLIKCGCNDPVWATKIVKSSIRDFSAGKVSFPIKTVQRIGGDNNRILCLPAVNFAKEVAGVKWASVFPDNPLTHRSQNLTAVILLTEITTGSPIAILDGSLCSNMRTAAVTTLAAQSFSIDKPETLVIFGGGEQSIMHIIFLSAHFPSLKNCHIITRSVESADSTVSKLKNKLLSLQIHSLKGHTCEIVKEADIVITATSSQGPHLKADWLKQGVFYGHIGGWEDEFEVALNADKIVCDDWEHVKAGSQTLAKMYKRGLIEDSSIYADLTEVIAGVKPERTDPSERVYFNAIGLSYADVTLAHAIYQKVRNHGFGQALSININRYG